MNELFARALLWTGEPTRGFAGRPANNVFLDPAAGESITLDGIRLERQLADWGYSYVTHDVRATPADGRWTVRVAWSGRTATAEIAMPPSAFVDFPTTPVSVAAPLTLRWSPAFPAGTETRAMLRCGDAEPTAIGLDHVTFTFRPDPARTPPCTSTVEVIASVEAPVGTLFTGGNIAATVWLRREIDLVP